MPPIKREINARPVDLEIKIHFLAWLSSWPPVEFTRHTDVASNRGLDTDWLWKCSGYGWPSHRIIQIVKMITTEQSCESLGFD